MGIFRCDNPEHKESFTTDNLKQWLKHKAEHNHVTRGVAPCAECQEPEQPILYEGKLHNGVARTLCPKCRAKIGAAMDKAEAH